MVLWRAFEVSILILDRFAFQAAWADRRTSSKFQSGISVFKLLPATSALTPEIPVFTEITSPSLVWKCSRHFRDVPLASRTDEPDCLSSEIISAEAKGLENCMVK